MIQSLFGIGQLSPHILSHYLIYAGMYVVLVARAYWFHLPFEANTFRVPQWIKPLLFAPGYGSDVNPGCVLLP